MAERIIKHAPPAPGVPVNADYDTVVSALSQLLEAAHMLPMAFPAEYHDKMYYARKNALEVLAAAQHRLQATGLPVCDHKSTVGLGGYCSECGLPKPPRA